MGWKLFRSGVITIAQCARSGDCSISGHSCRRIRPESAEARSLSINRVNREVDGSVIPVAQEVGNRQVYGRLDGTLVYRRIMARRQIVIWQCILQDTYIFLIVRTCNFFIIHIQK